MKNRKSIIVLLSICSFIGMIGCGCSKSNEDSVIVSEPYSIGLYFEKKHSGKITERRLFEVDTKLQFDRLVNKYKIKYNQNDCKYEFDKEFFKSNKVYIIHRNYYGEPYIRKYMIKRSNDIIEIVIYEAFYELQTLEEKIGYHGDLIAVSKEFAEDAKEVTFEYKGYNEYDEE